MSVAFLIMAFLGGGAAAYFYTMMLWENVKSITSSNGNMFLAAGGFAVRIGFCVFVFILSGLGGHVERVIACTTGFIVVRMIRVYVIKNRKIIPDKNNADQS